MLFGKSLFQSVVERLAAEAEESGAPEEPKAYRVSGLSTAFVAEGVEHAPAAAVRLDAYLALMPDPEAVPVQAKPEPPAMPDYLARLDRKSVV